jgi:hypothetical protein
VIVAEQTPATAPLGTETWITGFHVAELSPCISVAVTTACAALDRPVSAAAANVAEPASAVRMT